MRPFPGEAFVGLRSRFEALEIPAGWTVVDLEAEAVAAPRIRWDRETAELVADVLRLTPGYAVPFAWSQLEEVLA